MKTNLFDKINTENFISKNDVILIALSGGADSIFLAEYFKSIKDEYSLTLKAAHIEHGIRGQESLEDCCFVEKYCKENNIECFTLHINASAEAKKAGLSVEEYSRNKRYEFFNSIPCDKIATAHTLSDNIETLVFRLVRGTSVKGLCGIPSFREKIIRPLLNLTGEEIRNYLDEGNIRYCVDSTNSSNEYSRNHIRNRIVPLFTKLNESYEAAFERLFVSLNEDNDFIESEADKCFDRVYNDNMINIKILNSYHISIIKRIIIKYFLKNNISLNEYKISEILNLLYHSGKIQMSGNIYAVSNKNFLRIADFDKKKINIEYFFTKEILSYNKFLNKCEFCSKKFDFCCDCDKIIGSVAIRSRQSGDRISPAGRACTKSLKKLFNELEIPVEIRDRIPVITDDNGIIGIYGYCVDERVKITDSTKNVIVINVDIPNNFNAK